MTESGVSPGPARRNEPPALPSALPQRRPSPRPAAITVGWESTQVLKPQELIKVL